jgi:hypothetical protein
VAALRDLEAVIFREQSGFLVPVELPQREGVLLVMDIGDSLKKSSGKT